MMFLQTVQKATLPAVLAALCWATPVAADTVQMPNPSTDVQLGRAPWNVPIPSRGMTKAEVEASFGQPLSMEGPAGTPPIYYWEYTAYTVYFEGQHVIHAVRKYKPE